MYENPIVFYLTHSNSIRSSSTATESPALTLTDLILPSRSLFRMFCIFMASIMQSSYPSTTVSPGATATETTAPGIGDKIDLVVSILITGAI